MIIKECHGCEKDFATECPEDNYCRTCRGDVEVGIDEKGGEQ